jgi:hypothetical protein
MANIKTRLRRLETRLLDASLCAPQSEEWYAFWAEQAYRQLRLHESGPRIPLAAFDALLRRARARRAQNTTPEEQQLAERRSGHE